MTSNPSTYTQLVLRVKRPYTETPVECFNTFHPSKKRRRQMDIIRNPSREAKRSVCFRYVGSMTSETTPITVDDNNNDADSDNRLEDMGASGACNIVFASSSTAHVIDPDVKLKIPYKMTVSGGKRTADMAPHAIPENYGDSSDNSDSSLPPPSKQLRVIDLQCPPSKDPLAITLNGLRLVASKVPEKDNAEPRYVYDVYRIDESSTGDRLTTQEYISGCDENGLKHSSLFPTSDDDDEIESVDDDSDSNSESNWRNDYPDEEDDDEDENFVGHSRRLGRDSDEDELDEYAKSSSDSDTSDSDDSDDDANSFYRHRIANLSHDALYL